jgi:hypothetical protein
MPPRKRARQTRQSNVRVHSKSKFAKRTLPCNGSFATLPAELILLIISFLPGIPVPYYQLTPIADDTYFRSRALFALSQTNSWLRKVVFPFVWESFEVCHIPQTLPWLAASRRASKRKATNASSLQSNSDGSEITSSDKKKLATELVWMMEIVMIRDPSRAETIQYVAFSDIAMDHNAYHN